MTYSETLKYLYDKLPMFTRIGAAAIKKDVDNTLVLCEHLGNPQEKYKTIHVGGTNGKGSTSHMLAAILQKAGYKTGLYTSPHLKDFRERIRVNGEMMSESFVVSFTEGEKEHIEEIDPSFFEVTVAMAFAYFAEEKVDVAVVEVGLGGRLDSTNIIMPELSVITNISFDHMNVLGNTLQEIAWEKAGIIKKGIPVVIGEKQEESAPTFISKAAETDLHVADTIKDGTQLVTSVYKNDLCIFKHIRLDLTGSYQLKNLLTVIESVLVLNERGFSIPDEAVYSGLANTVEITGLQGRWQTLSQNPLVICDTGHNIAGIQEVLQNIQATSHKHLHMVIGMLKDKDVISVLRLLPATATYYFCQPILERALPAAELAQQAEKFNLKGEIFNTVTLALDAARHHAGPDDLIFVGGSTFVVAEAI
jgi:dihydrofolate synthase/folylpolyglutamate synthase